MGRECFKLEIEKSLTGYDWKIFATRVWQDTKILIENWLKLSEIYYAAIWLNLHWNDMSQSSSRNIKIEAIGLLNAKLGTLHSKEAKYTIKNQFSQENSKIPE